jgi:hypothetical protein
MVSGAWACNLYDMSDLSDLIGRERWNAIVFFSQPRRTVAPCTGTNGLINTNATSSSRCVARKGAFMIGDLYIFLGTR